MIKRVMPQNPSDVITIDCLLGEIDREVGSFQKCVLVKTYIGIYKLHRTPRRDEYEYGLISFDNCYCTFNGWMSKADMKEFLVSDNIEIYVVDNMREMAEFL
jgi:hypothetical protein